MKDKRQKLKILFICQNFWPENFRSTDVVNNLTQDGHHVEVLTSNPNYPEGKIYKGYKWYNSKTEKFNSNIKIHRVPTIPRGRSNYFLIILNYLGFIIFGTFFGLQKLKRTNFDIILVFASSPIFQLIIGYFIKKQKNIKLITWVQDLWPENLQAVEIINNRFILKIIHKFTLIFYRLNDAIIAQSKSFKKVLKKRFNKKVYFIPNYAEIFKNIKTKKVKDSRFVLVYAGNLGRAQKLITLLKAAKKIKENKKIVIKIFGDGIELNKLLSYKKKNRLDNVIIYGKVSKKRIYREYKNADALYLSLVNNKFLNYTIPAKLQTYLYISKPIIASASGETKKIIEDSNAGICTPPENVNLLYKSLNKIMKLKKNELKKFENNSKKYFNENYERNLINKKFRNIFENYRK